MKKKPKENQVIILNGTKVWFGAIAFLIIHGGAGMWWAATVSNKVDMTNLKVTQIAEQVEENRKETKQDIKDLRLELITKSKR